MRKHVKSMFSQRTENALFKGSEELSVRLRDFIAELRKEQSVIGTFHPLKDEIVWFLKWDLDKYKTAFPRIGKNSMQFFLSSLNELIEWSEGGISFNVPPEGRTEVVPDILLIPGLAFDEKGNRLGRGKGFFDKYLAGFTGIKIGLCYEFQVFEDIPLEPHDQLMNYVVTDKRILKME